MTQASPSALSLLLILIMALPACQTFDPQLDVLQDSINSGPDRFERITLLEDSDITAEYYISRPSEPSPLILYIQGSGCDPVFVEAFQGDYASTVFSFTTMAKDNLVTTMIIEKPHSSKTVTRKRGAAKECSDEFNSNFSANLWLDTVQVALNHAMDLAWVDDSKLLVIGFSEGATIASALAAQDSRVTHLGLVGASGPSQIFDFHIRAYETGGDAEQILENLNAVENTLESILAEPDATGSLFWGHTALRWTSFFAMSSLENLKLSNAAIYLISGMADESVPIQSTELLFSELKAAGKDIQFRRIPEAGHNLLGSGRNAKDVEADILSIKDWFQQSPSQEDSSP